jgi:hypothetical protein
MINPLVVESFTLHEEEIYYRYNFVPNNFKECDLDLSNSCWFRMFIGKLSVLQVHIVVGSEYSWAIMTNLGHITGSL